MHLIRFNNADNIKLLVELCTFYYTYIRSEYDNGLQIRLFNMTFSPTSAFIIIIQMYYTEVSFAANSSV